MHRTFAYLRRSLLAVHLLRNKLRRGVTAIEFAFIAPIFFLFLIGLIEMSLFMLTQHLIENATYNASRLSKTGFVEEGKTQLETVMDVIVRELGGLSPLINISRLSFNTVVYGNLSEIGVGEGGSGLGTASQIVVFTVSYPWQIFTPLIGNIIGDENRIVNITSRIVVKNEPYN